MADGRRSENRKYLLIGSGNRLLSCLAYRSGESRVLYYPVRLIPITRKSHEDSSP